MLILGIIFIIAGGISAIYGNSMNSSLERQLTTLFESGTYNSGTPFIIAGVLAIVLGIILVIVSLVRRSRG